MIRVPFAQTKAIRSQKVIKSIKNENPSRPPSTTGVEERAQTILCELSDNICASEKKVAPENNPLLDLDYQYSPWKLTE